MLRDRSRGTPRNRRGSWTKASPHLYPHQWSWDSAFIAIGWAHLDVRRAIAELEQLFTAQWSTGMVPHIVFRAGPDQPYFPGPEWWDCAISPAAPAPPIQTTGICQPPVHALALQRIWELTPVWPIINWLLWHALSRLGYAGRADELRRDSLGQLATGGEFAEYFEPFTGMPLGSPQQSWTAAVALDWLAADNGDEAR